MGRVALFGVFLYLYAKSLYTLLFKLINVAYTVVNRADWKAFSHTVKDISLYAAVHPFEQRIRASICGDEVEGTWDRLERGYSRGPRKYCMDGCSLGES
jgi:hypothetical protein